MLDPDDQGTLRRLSELRRRQPADATLKNLLGAVSRKLDLDVRTNGVVVRPANEGKES